VLDRSAQARRDGELEGGVEIEEVAARSPEKILREWFDPLLGLGGYQRAGSRSRSA
jgi:succinyl-CoA synthetase beta subunit